MRQLIEVKSPTCLHATAMLEMTTASSPSTVPSISCCARRETHAVSAGACDREESPEPGERERRWAGSLGAH